MTAAAIVDDDLLPIADLCDGQVLRKSDGWRNLIYMERLRFLAKGVQVKMDALLCLNHNNPTYPTKLYLSDRVDTGSDVNWNDSAVILDRNWQTFSWKDVLQGQRPIDILAAHLSALNRARIA